MRNFTTYLNFLVLLLALPFQASAQKNAPCGMTLESSKEVKRQMMENRAEMRDYVFDRAGVTYVPIRFYLVAKSDGTGRPSERLALRAMCNLNESYAEQDVQFYLKEFKYYNNSDVYSNAINNGSKIKTQMIYNALNIFIVDDVGEDLVLAYYQPPATGPNKSDWIVAIQSAVDDDHTLAHEMGHYFSLPHPFFGWEETVIGWDPAINGNPVGIWSPDGDTRNEFVNGSNCDDAGDNICDTPADYMFPYPGSDNCTYNLDAKDPSGALLAPEMKNFMNYAECGDYFFTPNQKENIQNSLFSTSRNYINPGIVPNTNEVSGTPTLVAPGNNIKIDTYNSILFEWTAISGADRYLLEISPVGSGNTQRLIVFGTNHLATNLEANRNYFWRVLGFNEYYTCAGFSSQNILKTGDLLNDATIVPSINDWSVEPNPVRSNASFFVNVTSNNGVKAKVSIYSITGQTLSESEYSFNGGFSTLEIPTNGLAPGMYIVALQTEAGTKTKRIAIVE